MCRRTPGNPLHGWSKQSSCSSHMGSEGVYTGAKISTLVSHTMLHTTLRPNVHWAHTSRCMLFPCSLPCQGTAPGDWCAVHTPRGRVVAGVVRGTLAALVFRLVPPSRGSRQLLFRQFTPMHVFVMNAKHLEVRILSFMR